MTAEVVVPHTRAEYECAKMKGRMNWEEAVKDPYYKGSKIEEWEIGFIGEDVVAKYFGVYPHYNKNRSDVFGFQVRSINREKNHLIIRESDKKYRRHIYILVYVDHQKYRHKILGWILCDDAMTDKYRKKIFRRYDPDGADYVWMVPPSDLKSVEKIGRTFIHKKICERRKNK